MPKLSIIIPARNEEYLHMTVEDVLRNMRDDTEIIAVLDGAWANPPLQQHPRLHVLYYPYSIGQRAAINAGVRFSRAQFVMKLDAHCAVAEGFDTTLMEWCEPSWTVVPVMRNLHVFDWVCDWCGYILYQGRAPKQCEKCDATSFHKETRWFAKPSPQSKSYCFDSEPHFQYFRDWNKRKEGQGDLTETMSLQGSCFMMHRTRYWEIEPCDESFGSWGSQGIEVAAKSWLSGGQVLCNGHTWYAHLFRTQGGDFGFPYPLSGNQVEHAKQCARTMFFDGQWQGMKRPLSWLVEKFAPVPGWSAEDLQKLKEREKKQ